MPGFIDSVSNHQNLVFADNADFSGVAIPVEANGLQTDGQLWIGTTTPNAGGTHISVGKITSPGATVNVGYSGGNITVDTASSGTDLHVANFIVGPGASANYTTIAAAITAAGAGPATIFIQPGIYTENPALVPTVNLVAFDADALTPTVTINGNVTCSGIGVSSISGIRLQTNSAPFLTVSGSVASIVNLKNCYLNCLNNTGISYTSSSAGAGINIIDCKGDLGTTGIALFAYSGLGSNLTIVNTDITNSGASTTANTISSGTVTLRRSFIRNPITTSSTAGLIANFLHMSTSNSTCLTIGGSTGALLTHCDFDSGSASSISTSTNSTSIFYCDVRSTNTNAITGVGTVILTGVSFSQSSSLVNTTTQTILRTLKGAYIVALPAGDYTCLGTDEIVGATTSAARAITLMNNPATGQVVTIKDITGTANTHNITITPTSGNIDGSATYVINTNYGSVDLWYSGTQWFAS